MKLKAYLEEGKRLREFTFNNPHPCSCESPTCETCVYQASAASEFFRDARTRVERYERIIEELDNGVSKLLSELKADRELLERRANSEDPNIWKPTSMGLQTLNFAIEELTDIVESVTEIVAEEK